jgi:FkbM family methyltransferase
MPLFSTLKFITEHPLNRDHKLNSILRFAKWQLQSRLDQRAIVWDWVNGARFLAKSGETGLTGNIYTGLHEFQDMGFLLHVLRDNDFFVDVGANSGSYTILACAAIGARGVAFEPVPSTYQRLLANMQLNDLNERVLCVNKGVGASETSIVFTNDSDTMNRVIAANEISDNTVSVDVTTLDTCLRSDSPSLIKIDVEGYETQVLEGAEETLQQPSLHSVIMELNGSGKHYGYDESRILEQMFDYGFKTYSYNPLERKLVSLQGKNLNSGNTLFIRDKALVEERLRTAPKVSINAHNF